MSPFLKEKIFCVPPLEHLAEEADQAVVVLDDTVLLSDTLVFLTMSQDMFMFFSLPTETQPSGSPEPVISRKVAGYCYHLYYCSKVLADIAWN